jgi:hypothetical protein
MLVHNARIILAAACFFTAFIFKLMGKLFSLGICAWQADASGI